MPLASSDGKALGISYRRSREPGFASNKAIIRLISIGSFKATYTQACCVDTTDGNLV